MPWADAVYGCDAAWWVYRQGLPSFHGWKFTFAENGLSGFDGITKVKIDRYLDRMLFGEVGRVGAGGNSGFQALNLAVQFGASKILLIGFDMTDANGLHWYGRNTWRNSANPGLANFQRWTKAFDTAAAQLAQKNVKVFNCSPLSALRAFPVVSVEDALAA